MKTKTTAMLAVAACSLTMPQSAQAQAWIGQVVGDMMAQQQAAANEHACMSGDAPEEKEIVEARGPANAQLQSYFTAMQTGSAPRSAFFAVDKRTAFTDGDTVLDRDTIDQARDSLAVEGARLESEPLGFYRSFVDAMAYGQWPVRDEAGRVTGVYNAFFVRKLGDWKLRTLTLEQASDYSGPVAQFCHKPGDVLPYRLDNSKGRMDYHGRRLEKAEAKLAKALEDLAKYKGKLAEKPESARAKDRVVRANTKVEKWEGEVLERKTALDTATADNQAALADQERLPALKQEAMMALGISN